MICARKVPFLCGPALSGLMSLTIWGLSSARALGLIHRFAGMWLPYRAVSRAATVPTELVAVSVTRRLVVRLVAGPTC